MDIKEKGIFIDLEIKLNLVMEKNKIIVVFVLPHYIAVKYCFYFFVKLFYYVKTNIYKLLFIHLFKYNHLNYNMEKITCIRFVVQSYCPCEKELAPQRRRKVRECSLAGICRPREVRPRV